jgi:hypothetical protein
MPALTYMAGMFWADALETNIDRLRRYAAFSCGSYRAGDNVVFGKLDTVLMEIPSAEPANLPLLFRRLDEALRSEPPGHADEFAEFGRWQFLGPIERRILLLIAIEGFSCQQAAAITGISYPEAKAHLGRARMKYADRFPARVGLIGADAETRDLVVSALDLSGFQLLWSIDEATETPQQAPEPPSAIILVGGQAQPPILDRAPANAIADMFGRYGISRRMAHDFAGPIILANGTSPMERIDGKLWRMPLSDLRDPDRFRPTLVRTLLFSS